MPFYPSPGLSARQALVGAKAAKTSLHDAPMGEEDARWPGLRADDGPAGTDLTLNVDSESIPQENGSY